MLPSQARMRHLTWTFDGDAWVATLSMPAFPDLTIRVVSGSNTFDPDPIQLLALTEIQQMTLVDLSRMRLHARKYARSILDGDEISELSPDDCEIFIESATIPRLRGSCDTYAFLSAHWAIDPENGICFICKNGAVMSTVSDGPNRKLPDWNVGCKVDELGDA